MSRVFVVLIAIASVAYCSYATRDAPESRSAASPALSLPACAGLEGHVRAAASPVQVIEEIRCSLDRDSYMLTVVYNQPPAGIGQVETLSGAVAMSALEYLQSQGVDPSSQGVFLSVWSQKPEPGVTGKPMWRVYGRTIYNHATDQLEFKEQR